MVNKHVIHIAAYGGNYVVKILKYEDEIPKPDFTTQRKGNKLWLSFLHFKYNYEFSYDMWK